MTVRTRDASTGMTWVPGGSFLMGSEEFYPEERPVRRVEVDGFRMDDHPVTVTEFRRFAAATGYVTVAERPIAVASPACEKHVRRHPLVGGSTVIARHAAQAWLVTKQADR